MKDFKNKALIDRAYSEAINYICDKVTEYSMTDKDIAEYLEKIIDFCESSLVEVYKDIRALEK